MKFYRQSHETKEIIGNVYTNFEKENNSAMDITTIMDTCLNQE